MKQFKKVITTAILSFFTIVTLNTTSSNAVELDDAVRTVPLNSTKTITLTPEQVKRGKRLFINTCSLCHVGGITKTNPNVGLDSEALSLATPARNSTKRKER